MQSWTDRDAPIEAERIYRNADGSTNVETIVRAATAAIEPVKRRERRPSLAAVITEAGFAGYDDISAALAEGTATGERLGEVLIRRGFLDEEQLAELLAEQWGLRYLPGSTIRLDPAATNRLRREEAHALDALPVGLDGTQLVVAVAEPSDERLARLRERLGDVSFAVVSRGVLTRLIDGGPVAMAPDAPAARTRLAARLAAIVSQVEGLETELAAARTRIDQSELTIGRLENAVAMRDELLGVLRAKIARLGST